MRGLIAALLLCAAAWAQPVNPPPGILKGNPPGGIGAACSGTPLLGYLDSSGRVITCVSTVWTVTGGGGSLTPPVVVAGVIANGNQANADPTTNLIYPGTYIYGASNTQQTYTGGNVGGYIEGNTNYVLVDPATNITDSGIIATDAQTWSAPTNSKNILQLLGGYYIAAHQGSGTVAQEDGLTSSVYNGGAGTVTRARSLFAYVSNYGAGTIGTGYGSYIAAAANAGGGHITTLYGQYIGAQNVGDTSYNLYSDGVGTNNMFVGKVSAGGGVFSTGTTFTASGCGNGTLVGGSTAGKFTSGDSGGSCSIVITMGSSATAANGWSCQVQDLSAPAKVWGQSASSATTATFLSPGVTTSTNVVSFFCVGY